MRESSQLFRVVSGVNLPSHMDLDLHVVENERKTLMAFCWPDGSPCIPVENFLLDKSYDVTVRDHDGGTLKALASHLTHLARFCFNQSIQFWDLDDTSFRQFVTQYLPKNHSFTKGFKSRNNNTIRAIVRTCVAFLQWLQTNVTTERIIVGSRDFNPQIRLVSRIIRHSKYESSTILSYQFSPKSVTPEPKGPVSDAIRNALWEATASGGRSAIERKYLTARREQMLSLLEATGCRPGELAMLGISANVNPTLENAIFMLTEKRRLRTDPRRRIPVSMETSLSLERFMKVERKDLINELRNRGYDPDDDFVFLSSTTGKAMSPGSLTKDFDRIAERAGITQRACMSMFRHRFITIMVALHLQDYLGTHHETSFDEILIVDRISILTRVATITGHRHPESLLHYLDLAWEHLSVFKPIERAIDIARLLNESAVHLRTIGKGVMEDRKYLKSQIIETTCIELRQLEERIRKLINPADSE